MDANLEVIVLAAGQGKRMHSAIPKVLHELGGQPLLGRVLACARALSPRAIHVVLGHGAEHVRERFPDTAITWVCQREQKGTGDAVRAAIPGVPDDALVLVLYGDVPLISPDTLRTLAAACGNNGLALLTAELADPEHYGRVIRDRRGAVARVVEHSDAHPDQLATREVNTGFLAASAGHLKAWLSRLDNANAQGEYYLTDIVAMAAADGVAIVTRSPRCPWEILGVNSRRELAHLERILQKNEAERLMQQGVTLRDPNRFDLRGELIAGRDVVIDVNVILEGKVELGDGVRIGPNNVIRDCAIGPNTEILANCVIEEAVIGADCRIGPFARLRPENRIADRARIGNFVEIKKSEVGAGSKINHLSYVGDTIMGRDVNVGAGTITCNYDGANKYRTVIGDGAFIGSDTQLIAPVTVGENATIGAGSTVVKDAPAGELTLSRAQQATVRGWKRPVKGQPKIKK